MRRSLTIKPKNMRIKLQLLVVWFAILLGHSCLGEDSGVTLQTGGTQIVLSKGWERLDQPENFVVQKRALNAERKIALSAGTLKIDLTLTQYVALGIFGLEHGPEKGMELATKLSAERAHIPIEEVRKAVQSKIGQQTLEQLKKASALCSFEFLSVTNVEISAAPAFEIRSKMTILQSSQVIFNRQFVYQETGAQEIVQITYAIASDDVFGDKSLIDAIRRPK